MNSYQKTSKYDYLCNQPSISPLFLEFFHVFFLLELGYIFSFQPLLNFLSETFDTSIEEEQIIKSFFEKLRNVVNSWLLVVVVNYDDFVFLVFVVVHLRDELISLDVGTREVQGLTNMVFLVFILLT